MKKIKILSLIAVMIVGGMLTGCNKNGYDSNEVKKVNAGDAYADATKVNKVNDFEYTSGFDGITIVKYNGKDSEVTIPDEIDGENVVLIHRDAFDNDYVTKVVLPAGLQKLTTGQFDGCISLEVLIINSGLISIETYAFDGCNNLKEIIVPDSVTDVRYNSFPDTSITKIYVESDDSAAALVLKQNLIPYEVR